MLIESSLSGLLFLYSKAKRMRGGEAGQLMKMMQEFTEQITNEHSE